MYDHLTPQINAGFLHGIDRGLVREQIHIWSSRWKDEEDEGGILALKATLFEACLNTWLLCAPEGGGTPVNLG